MYFDPRYIRFQDMPAIIRHMTNVRMADIKKEKDKYINVDKLEYICSIDKSKDSFKDEIHNVTGINFAE